MSDFHLTKSNLGGLVQMLTELLTSGNDYRVSVKQWRGSRSLSQNALYWKWLGEISMQALVNGNTFTADTWHEYFKKYWCPVTVVEMPAGGDIKVKTTSKLDAGQFCHYLNQIEQWCQGHVIRITIPEDCQYRQLMDKQNA